MNRTRKAEHGEGKVGCIVSLLLLAVVIAVAIKVVPVLYSNNSFLTAAEDLGSRAGILNRATIEQQLRAKAVELEIPEAAAKGAFEIEVLGDRWTGTTVIKVHYTRKVDLFGIYTLPMTTEKTINRPYMDAR